MINTTNLVAVQGSKQDNTLGNLVWFSVSDIEILRSDLLRMAALAGLEEKYIPAPIRSADAFRRATSEVAGVLKTNEDRTEVLMVREVLSAEDRVIRHVIKEVRDKKNVRLSYEQIGVIEFDRQYEQMNTFAVTDEAKPALQKATILFGRYRDYFVADHLRRLMKNVLGACKAVGVRPAGAVYFTPKGYERTIVSLHSLVQALPNNAVEMHYLPVVDAVEQRTMVETKLHTHVMTQLAQIGGLLGGNADVLGVKKTLKSLSVEFASVLREQKVVSKTTANNAIQQLQNLKSQVSEYEGLLESNLGEVRSMPRTPFDGQYKQMVNCTLREVLRKCQNTVQNLKWKQLNV